MIGALRWGKYEVEIIMKERQTGRMSKTEGPDSHRMAAGTP